MHVTKKARSELHECSSQEGKKTRSELATIPVMRKLEGKQVKCKKEVCKKAKER